MVLAVTTLVALLLGAHPGHGSTVVIGTLRTVTPTAITIDVRDVATGAVTAQKVLVDTDTKYREGKTPVTDVAPYIGTRAVASVDFEEGPSGDTIYRASEVRLTKPKR